MFFSEETVTIQSGLYIPCTDRRKAQRLRASAYGHPAYRKAIFNGKCSAWRHPVHCETFSHG